MALIALEPVDEATLTIRLNRPESMNALSAALRVELLQALQDAERGERVRCVVLAGDERAFSAGADLNELGGRVGPVEMMRRRPGAFWDAIASIGLPLVSAVRGYALGGGCELALATDIVIAGRSARFGLPEVRVGLMPGAGGTQRLPRLAGPQAALLPLLTGEHFGADDALRMGIVSRVVDDASVEDAAIELAQRIARLPPLAVRQIKQVVYRGLEGSLATGLALERSALQALLATEDRAEGVAAFLEKRSPVFTGR